MHDPRNIEMGRRLLNAGWLSQDECFHCLEDATRRQRSFLASAVELGCLSLEQAQRAHQGAMGASPVQSHDSQPIAAMTPPPSPRSASSDSDLVATVAPSSSPSGPSSHGPSSAEPDALPEAGDVVGGYAVVRKIGQGGMGAVYEVEQAGQRYALKVITTDNEQALARFEREALAAAKAGDHPHIVSVRTFSKDAVRPFLVLDFIRGEGFDDRLKRGAVPLEESLSILAKVADAVEHMHANGILHRDLKPANIIIRGEDGEPMVTDFGLARLAEAESLTRTADLLGTPAYMSPEQAGSEHGRVDERTDIWALGVMLYELTTRERPYAGDTAIQIMKAIMFKEPKRPRALDPSMPVDVETIILQALAKEPEDRYPTAADFAADCRAVLEGEPIAATRLTRRQQWQRKYRRLSRPMKAATWLLTVATLALLIGAPWFVYDRWVGRQSGAAFNAKLTSFLKHHEAIEGAVVEEGYRRLAAALGATVPEPSPPARLSTLSEELAELRELLDASGVSEEVRAPLEQSYARAEAMLRFDELLFGLTPPSQAHERSPAGLASQLVLASRGEDLMDGPLDVTPPFKDLTELVSHARGLAWVQARQSEELDRSAPADITELLARAAVFEASVRPGVEFADAALRRLALATLSEALARLLVGGAVAPPDDQWRAAVSEVTRRLLDDAASRDEACVAASRAMERAAPGLWPPADAERFLSQLRDPQAEAPNQGLTPKGFQDFSKRGGDAAAVHHISARLGFVVSSYLSRFDAQDAVSLAECPLPSQPWLLAGIAAALNALPVVGGDERNLNAATYLTGHLEDLSSELPVPPSRTREALLGDFLSRAVDPKAEELYGYMLRVLEAGCYIAVIERVASEGTGRYGIVESTIKSELKEPPSRRLFAPFLLRAFEAWGKGLSDKTREGAEQIHAFILERITLARAGLEALDSKPTRYGPRYDIFRAQLRAIVGESLSQSEHLQARVIREGGGLDRARLLEAREELLSALALDAHPEPDQVLRNLYRVCGQLLRTNMSSDQRVNWSDESRADLLAMSEAAWGWLVASEERIAQTVGKTLDAGRYPGVVRSPIFGDDGHQARCNAWEAIANIENLAERHDLALIAAEEAELAERGARLDKRSEDWPYERAHALLALGRAEEAREVLARAFSDKYYSQSDYGHILAAFEAHPDYDVPVGLSVSDRARALGWSE